MIFDQFGKPVHREQFIAVERLNHEAHQQALDWEAEQRLMELRNSLALAAMADTPFNVGNTVRVRLPKRFTVAE